MTTISTGLATSFIQFSRPGASGGGATVTDRDGKIKWAGHNLLTHSESFDNAAWNTASGVTITANNAVAPNGTTTADLYTATNTVNYRGQTGVTVVAAQHTQSCFVKRGNTDWVYMNVSQTGGDKGAWFNVATGVKGTEESGVTASIQSVGSGWYLCSITLALTAGNVVAVLPRPRSGDNSTTTSALDTVLLWGAHLYRSDLGGMQLNPSMPAGMQSYYPTTPRNLVGYSEAFGSWGNQIEVQVSSNVTTAPNGLQTADKIAVNNGTTSGSPYVGQAVTSQIGVPYTYSIYVKKDATRYATVLFWYNSVNNAALQFDFDTVSIARSAATGSGYAVSATAFESVGNGWYRIRLTGTVGHTSTYPSVIGTNIAWTSGSPLVAQTGDGTSGVFVWGAQLSDSASLDTYVPVYGAAVTSAAYYAPRLDFDGATLAAKGLLVEEARTNLIRYSRTLETTSSYWANLASGTANTITVNNAAGPDGAATSASLLTFNTAVPPGVGTDYSVWRHALTTTANGTYTFSVWMKAGTTSSVYLLLNDSAGNRAVTQCTLTSSWQRFTVTGTTAASITGITVDIGGSGFFSSPVAAGTIYVYGAQLEAGAFSTSYIPNGATVAGATRTADVASVSTQAFPYSASEGTYVVSFVPVVSDTNSVVLSITDSSASNRIYTAGAASEHLVIASSGTPQVNLDAGSVTVGAVNKVGAAFAANNFAAVINGGTAATSTSGLMPVGVLNMSIGNYNVSGTYRSYHIRQVTYLPRRISNAELQSRTA